MSNELVIREVTNSVTTEVKGFLNAGSLHLPQGYSFENALMSAMLELPNIKDANKVPVLQACTPLSVKSALLAMVVQGLNIDKKQCSFIAYGEKLTLSRSYFGDMVVAKQVDTGIDDIFATAVFKDDVFEYEIKRGVITNIKHIQKIENKNKQIVAAYCTIVYKDSREISTVMTWEQITQCWRQSPTKPVNDDGSIKPDSTHGKYPEEMAKKTVVHRACKPIIDSSDDSNLVAKFAKMCDDDYRSADVEQEIAENANKEMIDIEFTEAPACDVETGEVIETKVSKEPF